MISFTSLQSLSNDSEGLPCKSMVSSVMNDLERVAILGASIGRVDLEEALVRALGSGMLFPRSSHS